MLNMYTLVGDIGNTDIKLCLLNKNLKIIKKITFDKHLYVLLQLPYQKDRSCF